MRDIAMFGLVFGFLPMMVLHPWIGTMFWTWVSIMNPHRLTWGYAFNFPFAALIAAATLFGLFVTKDYRKVPINAVTVSLLLFVGWMCVTAFFAVHPNEIGEMFRRVMKIQLMVFVTLCLLHTRQQLDIFVWVIAISLGFFGLKGGLFTLLGGGENRVWGPGGFIEGNNELALALIITIPLMNYLRMTNRNVWIRLALLGTMVLTALAAVGSHSRGAFLAIAAMGVFMWWRSPNKAAAGMALAILAVAIVAFMPAHWKERMETIQTYEQDISAMGRLNAWQMAYNLAKDRPFGASFHTNSPLLFGRYAPNPTDIRAAHSIYFQVMGEHGFIGLGLFLLFWGCTWFHASWIYRNARRSAETAWAASLAGMVQVSLVGYAVGGAFLSLAYFDLPYNMAIVIVVSRVILERHLSGRKPATVSRRGAVRSMTESAGPVHG